MRIYAAFIAEDNSGNLMTDRHLKKAITQYDSRFEQVYNQASGYIHLSEKAFYQTVAEISDNTIGIQIGCALPEKRNEPLLECAEAFCHFVKLHYKMLDAFVDSKVRYDQKQPVDE